MKSSNTLTNSQKELNQIQSNNIFSNLKSRFILKNIFNNLSRKQSLHIIHYNKNIQKRLNITINDFKEYSEIYSPIEIELIPSKNKSGKFINITNLQKEKYYHIYFNDGKIEINRNYLKENEQIKKIKIIIEYQVTSFEDLFHSCKCIESINFKSFIRKTITNMSAMFYGCSSLKEINLSKFNTDNVTNMGFMFSGCTSLEELNLSNFNTDKVTFMDYMFSGCSSLKKLVISNFSIGNSTDIDSLFDGCSYKFMNKIKAYIINIKKEILMNLIK